MWPPKGRPPFVDSYSAGAATDAVAGVAAWFSVWVALGVAAGAVYFGERVKIQNCIIFGERCINEGRRRINEGGRLTHLCIPYARFSFKPLNGNSTPKHQGFSCDRHFCNCNFSYYLPAILPKEEGGRNRNPGEPLNAFPKKKCAQKSNIRHWDQVSFFGVFWP